MNTRLISPILRTRYLLRRAWFVWALITCLFLMLDEQLAAQTKVHDPQWAHGYNGFALVCRSLDLEFETSPDRFLDDPAKSIAVVFSNYPISQRVVDGNYPISQRVVDEFLGGGGAILVTTDTGVSSFRGLTFDAGPISVTGYSDRFLNSFDCPLIRRFESHAVTDSITIVPTNRTGGIQVQSGNWEILARLPESARKSGLAFLAASTDDSGFRGLVIGDPSVFSNQMIVQGDNARLALQTMNWLKNGQRNRVFLFANSGVAVPDNPQELDIEIPRPTPDQVWDALKNLPPDLMMNVGNEVAKLAEEENLVNEAFKMFSEWIDPEHIARWLFFIPSILLGGFLFYRYMSSESTLQDATGTEMQNGFKPIMGWLGMTSKCAEDRHLTARELVSRFYFAASDETHEHYHSFPKGLTIQDEQMYGYVRLEMNKVASRLNWKSRSWWTQERLLDLNTQLELWAKMLEKGELTFQSPETSSRIKSVDT